MINSNHSKQNNTTQVVESLPWHRYPIVWFAFSLPLIVVIASIITIIIANINAPIVIAKADAQNSIQLNKQATKEKH